AELPTPFAPSTLQSYMLPEDFIPVPASSPTPGGGEQSGALSSSGQLKKEYAVNGMYAGSAADSTPTPAPSEGPSETPSEAPEDADSPVYPTLDVLLGVPGAHTAVAWPVTGTASGALLTHLGAAAAEQGNTGVALLASANTAQGAETRTVPARGVTGDASVLVYDASISAALRNAASVQHTLLRGAPLTAAAAQLALAAAEVDGQLLLSVDRGPGRTRIDLSAA